MSQPRDPHPAPPTPPADPDFDWDSAVRVHHRRVVISVMALGIPIDRAEEIANAAWMRLVQEHRAGHLDRVRLPGLAIRQARFLALNALRKEGEELRRRVHVLPGHPLLRDRELDPEQRLLSRDRLLRCLKALGSCSDRERTVFRLVYVDPAPSHGEVAERLGLSVQRVRQILCELRQKLRRAVEEEP